MPRKFLVTDTSTEIREYEQDHESYQMTRSYMTRMENMIPSPLEHWPRRWPVMRLIGKKTHSGDQLESDMEVEEIEPEKQEDVTRYINGEKVNIKETA